MLDWTDRHCRYLHRQMSRWVLLYTEMVTAAALVRGGARHLVAFDEAEHPVALQLGGSDPRELAAAARIGAEEGYDEVNLNVGCPSDRVQSGCFGAVLMRRPELVAACAAEMIAASRVEVTVKCRLGVDEQDPEEVLPVFLRLLREAGVRRVAIHARKAWLDGLSPKENRDIPPLDRDLALRMKRMFPDLHISINGGIGSLAEARSLLGHGFDGVMVGRAAYHKPADMLLAADPQVFGDPAPCSTPEQVVERMIPYLDRRIACGGRLHDVTRHMLGLFAGRPGARIWRRLLSEGAHRPGATAALVRDALSAVSAEATRLAS